MTVTGNANQGPQGTTSGDPWLPPCVDVRGGRRLPIPPEAVRTTDGEAEDGAVPVVDASR